MSGDDDEQRMRFSTERDFKGGKWIGGEFYIQEDNNKRNNRGGIGGSKRKTAPNDSVYGVFAERGGLGSRKSSNDDYGSGGDDDVDDGDSDGGFSDGGDEMGFRMGKDRRRGRGGRGRGGGGGFSDDDDDNYDEEEGENGADEIADDDAVLDMLMKGEGRKRGLGSGRRGGSDDDEEEDSGAKRRRGGWSLGEYGGAGGGGGGGSGRGGGRGGRGGKGRPVGFVPSSQSQAKPPQPQENQSSIAPPPAPEPDTAVEAFKDILKSVSSEPEKPSGMSNDAFRDMLNASADAAAAGAQSNKVLPTVAVQQMGQWEKHTKGIGKKLLEKFGFKGRLGAKEDGISAAIEVKVRPNTMGLGFGDFKEATQLEVNKRLEAELKGVVYEPEKEKEAKAAAETAKKGDVESKSELTAEQRAASKGWKKGAAVGVGKKKQKVLLKDAMELLMESEKAEKKEAAILDMRGPSPKILRDIKDADTLGPSEESIAAAKPKLGQELLYNINLTVDLAEMELDSELRKFKKSVAQVEELKNQKKAFTKRLQSDTTKLEKLQAIDTILGRIESKLSSSSDDVTSADVITALMILRKEYPMEFSLLGLADLLPNLCRRMVSKRLGPAWKPLADPSRPSELFKEWFVAASDLDTLDSSTEQESKVRRSRSSLTPAFVQLAESLLTVNIRRCLQNDWNVKVQSDEAVRLLSGLHDGIRGVSLISSSELSNILSTSVMPRIKREVESWSPELEKAHPIHWWLHPWIPLLKSELSDVYPDIRRKIGKYISNWNPMDSTAHTLLAPWKGVFDATSMGNLILRAVVPKLVASMRSIPIDPSNTTAEHTQLFSAIMTWHDLVPRIHFVSILEGEFFPRWLQILGFWMTSENPDFEEVTQWYLGWKSLIPEVLESDEVISGYFHYALDIMQHVLAAISEGASGGTAISASISSVPFPSGLIKAADYFEVVQKRQLEVAAKKRLEEMREEDRQRVFRSSGSSEYADFEAKEEVIRAATLGGSSASASGDSSYSFKEFIESYAARHGISFVPKPGRMHEGKQIYLFGTMPCYLDQAVVFAYMPTSSGHSWEPVSLEALLASSES